MLINTYLIPVNNIIPNCIFLLEQEIDKIALLGLIEDMIKDLIPTDPNWQQSKFYQYFKELIPKQK